MVIWALTHRTIAIALGNFIALRCRRARAMEWWAVAWIGVLQPEELCLCGRNAVCISLTEGVAIERLLGSRTRVEEVAVAAERGGGALRLAGEDGRVCSCVLGIWCMCMKG